MMQCRKIYYNLLLLSVMLFSFAAVSRPHLRLCISEQARWDAPRQESVEFRWDKRSGSIVYRCAQVWAAVGNELAWLLPADQELPRCYSNLWNKREFKASLPLQCEYMLPGGRAPPPAA